MIGAFFGFISRSESSESTESSIDPKCIAISETPRCKYGDLVTAHRGILVFLHLRAEAAEFGCDCRICLGKLFLEGFAPAEGNQGGDDYEFSQ